MVLPQQRTCGDTAQFVPFGSSGWCHAVEEGFWVPGRESWKSLVGVHGNCSVVVVCETPHLAP